MQIIENEKKYDVVIVGSGAGGGMATKILTDLQSKNQTKINSNKEVSIFNSKEVESFLEEFDKIDVDDISPRQSLDFLYKLKSKRQGNGKSKFKK